MNSRPRYFFVGPQKAGTSWVDAYLRWHGGVALPAEVKETMFFEQFYERGIDWYDSLFPSLVSQETRPFVEVAPTYFSKPEVRERILTHYKNIEIIISVREPVKRTFSSYLHEKRYGFIPPGTGFRQAVEEYHLEDPSRYFHHYSAWKNAVGKDKIHFIRIQDMRDLDGYAQQICRYLAIPYKPVPENLKKRINEADAPRNYFVASVISKMNRWSRKFGLFTMRNMLIQLGLKKFFYSSGKGVPEELKKEDREWLNQHYLREDWIRFEAVLLADKRDS